MCLKMRELCFSQLKGSWFDDLFGVVSRFVFYYGGIPAAMPGRVGWPGRFLALYSNHKKVSISFFPVKRYAVSGKSGGSVGPIGRS